MDNDVYCDLRKMRDNLHSKYENNPKYEDILKEVLHGLDCVVDSNPKHLTIGGYRTEKDAENHFDSLVNGDFFHNELQVRGRRLFDDKAAKIGEDGQIVRIDRILHPKPKAIESGWKYGPIAVEIKKSGLTVGPIYAQVLEYRQSIFQSEYLGYTRISPLVYAVFPSKNIKLDLHSLQATQYIFSCFHDQYNQSLKFNIFGINVLDIYPDGIRVGCWKPTTNKGHRGREK